MFYAISPYSHIGQHQNQSMSYIVTSCSRHTVISELGQIPPTIVISPVPVVTGGSRRKPGRRCQKWQLRDTRLEDDEAEVWVCCPERWREVPRPRTCRGHAEDMPRWQMTHLDVTGGQVVDKRWESELENLPGFLQLLSDRSSSDHAVMCVRRSRRRLTGSWDTNRSGSISLNECFL